MRQALSLSCSNTACNGMMPLGLARVGPRFLILRAFSQKAIACCIDCAGGNPAEANA